ncbi:MAG: SHOCT domain-containing protein [Anaerolineae bacterium]|nr:SHOCT domain-containing protein [Anaerolineae bacterium]
MNQAMEDLGIEGQEVTDSDMAQLEAADDAANAAEAAAQAPAAEAPAAQASDAEAPAAPEPAAEASSTDASTQPAYLDELKKLAELHEQGILTDEEFSAKKKQLLGL